MKAPVEIPTPHSESIICEFCGDEFGIEDRILYERETQRDRDHIHYMERIRNVLAAVRTEYPEVVSVKPLGTLEATRAAVRMRMDKWLEFISRFLE